jgi:glycosyltransferase involved in cell wall biosynthesis
MGADPAAVVLTGYAIDPAFVRGGAQRVAAQLCDRLTELGWRVRVIECAAWRESIDPEHLFATGIAGHFATAFDWRGAGPATEVRAEDVNSAVGRARIVLVVDRSVGRLDTQAHRVLLLSNLAYDNEREAAAHGDHDSVWVASPHLAQQLAAGTRRTRDGIRVVPPALQRSRCDPIAHRPLRALERQLVAAAVPRSRRLLFPHRADPGKGLTTALAVLRRLLEEDRWALVVVGPGVGEGAGAATVVDDGRRHAAIGGIADYVFWAPWLPQLEVACLYRLAGVTLMPTSLDEGFGLVAVESVAHGVPVVARSAGNLRTLADRFPSIHLADEVADVVRTVGSVSGRTVPFEERHAVREAFSVTAQRAAVNSALDAGAVRP